MSTPPPNPSPQPQASAPAPRSTQSLLAFLHNVRGDNLDELHHLIQDEPDPRERAKLHIAILQEVTRAEAVIIRRERQLQQHELAHRYLALAERREARAESRDTTPSTPRPDPTTTPPSPSTPRPLNEAEKDHLLAYFPDIAPESLGDPRAAQTWRAALEAQIAALLRRPKLPLPEGGGRGVGSVSASPIPSPATSPPPWHRHPVDARSDRLNADRIEDSHSTTTDAPPIPSEPQASACASTPRAHPTSSPSSPDLSTFQSALSACTSADPSALTPAHLAPVIAGLRTAFADLARAP